MLARDRFDVQPALPSPPSQVDLKYGIIPIYSKTLDLCTLLSEAHAKDPAIQECPIKPYTQKKVTFNEMIPNTFPSGTYKGTANVTDQSGNVVQCVQFDMKISDGNIVAPYIPHVPL